MQLPNFLLPLITIFAIANANAIPDSPVGASGSGDTGGTNSGDPVGSIAAASSAGEQLSFFFPAFPFKSVTRQQVLIVDMRE